MLYSYVTYIYIKLLWLWFEIKLILLNKPILFKYRETSDQPSKTTPAF